MKCAQWLTFVGLVLDFVGVLVIGFKGEKWRIQAWRTAPDQFDTRAHKWIYHACWGPIALGFALQAIAVLVSL
jgi:hypothetical protein